MASARGICPTCLKERRLTPQRQVLTTHNVDGVKCEGSGSKPSEITRLASGAHPSSGSAPTRAVPRSTQGQSVIKGPESPSILNDRNPLVECPTCLAGIRVESGVLPVHFISGSRCVRSGTHVSTLSQVPHCPVCDRVVMRVDSAGYVAQHLREVSDNDPSEICGSFVPCDAVGQRKPALVSEQFVRATQPVPLPAVDEDLKMRNAGLLYLALMGFFFIVLPLILGLINPWLFFVFGLLMLVGGGLLGAND